MLRASLDLMIDHMPGGGKVLPRCLGFLLRATLSGGAASILSRIRHGSFTGGERSHPENGYQPVRMPPYL
jgi:hypothetical protein